MSKYDLFFDFGVQNDISILDKYLYRSLRLKLCKTKIFVCKVRLLARTLGLKAREVRVYCIKPFAAKVYAVQGSSLYITRCITRIRRGGVRAKGRW